MTAPLEAYPSTHPAPPVTSPGRQDVTGGAGLVVVEDDGRPARGSLAYVLGGYGHRPDPREQVAVEWVLWGGFAEFAGVMCIGPGGLLEVHFAALVAWIAGSLARNGISKRRRIAAPQEG